MPAPVLLPAALILLGTEGRLLALADDLNAIGGDAEADQIVAHGGGAAIAEGEVVLGAASGIGVAFDRNLRRGPPLHPVGVLLQRRTCFVPDLCLVEIEEHVGQRLL